MSPLYLQCGQTFEKCIEERTKFSRVANQFAERGRVGHLGLGPRDGPCRT